MFVKKNGATPAGAEDWGCFALVCYVPDPLKSAIERLRESIPGRQLPPVHITVLPPRPLPLPVEEACSLVEAAACDFAAFEAELSELRRFPETDFLYLDIDRGSSHIRELHGRLSSGELRHPELFDFRPHLTLAGPVPHDRVAEVEREAARQWGETNLSRSVPVEELVCLWRAPGNGHREWVRVNAFSLKAADTHQTTVSGSGSPKAVASATRTS
jgi:2'-5' RNA ligase